MLADIDCAVEEDEDHCDWRDCSHAGIQCAKDGERFCLTDLSQFCNGEAFCDDGNDEDPRMWNEEQLLENYCLNSGRARLSNLKVNAIRDSQRSDVSD